MLKIKITLFFLLSILIGFGAWYLIFSLLNANLNPMEWSMAIRVLYFMIASVCAGTVFESLLKN